MGGHIDRTSKRETPGASALSRRALLVSGAAMAAVATLSPGATTAGEEEAAMGTASATGGSSDKNAIRPFPISSVTEADLSDMRRRVNGTKWPEREWVKDSSQGVP